MTGFIAVLFYVVWMQLLMLAYAFPRVPMALFGDRNFALRCRRGDRCANG